MNKSNLRLCNIQEPKGSMGEMTNVDATVVPSEEEFYCEESRDRMTEASLQKGFEAFSSTVRFPAFARASLSWLEDLCSQGLSL